MTIKDVRGIEVQLRDTVAFAGGGKGASEFYVGTVIKITNKGVKISYKIPLSEWDRGVQAWVHSGKFSESESQRNEGMFVILESCQ